MQISGSFYRRLQELFMYFSSLKDKEEFIKHYTKVISGKPLEDEYEYHLYTILALIHEVENNAKKANLTQFIDPEQDKISES